MLQKHRKHIFFFFLGLGLLTGPSPAIAGDLECTIKGTRGADLLRGTTGPDVICAGSGADRIRSLGGSDTVYAGSGADTVLAGAGGDTVYGGVGNDSLSGEFGSDLLMGEAGMDQINGAAGDDALMGGIAVDTLDPGQGDDVCAPDSADRLKSVCPIDRSGPDVTWLEVPETVSAGETLRATVSLKDVSGISPGSATAAVGGSPGWITSWCGFRIDAELISGTSVDGVWSVSCLVPENAVNDPYSLWLGAQDNFGNSTLGDWVEFRVIGGSSDNQAPAITQVDLPEIIQAGETATLTWRAADPSGVKGVYPWIYVPLPLGGVLYGPGIEEPRLVGGDTFDGVYGQTFTVPPNSPPGRYTVYISARDELGNKTYNEYASFTVPEP